jgi:predicted Rossmann fold nucleotide-binding protein DprA/Smf involved in DNA uptake
LEGKKVAVIGSRGFSDYELLSESLSKLNPKLIVSGGAKGADTLAEKYANEHGLDMVVYKPDYKKFGRGAPLKRNHTIVDNAEVLVAFWDGKSRGTKYTIDLANKKESYPVVIINY